MEHRTETRLTALEIKASYTEDLLDSLNQTIFRQQQQIDALVREMEHLRKEAIAAGAGGVTGPREDLPPHY